VTRRRVVVVTPREVRSYVRDSIQPVLSPDLGRGLYFRLVLRHDVREPNTSPRPAAADTVYRSLSFRDMLELSPQLDKLGAERPRIRVGVQKTPSGAGIRVHPRRRR